MCILRALHARADTRQRFPRSRCWQLAEALCAKHGDVDKMYASFDGATLSKLFVCADPEEMTPALARDDGHLPLLAVHETGVALAFIDGEPVRVVVGRANDV